MTAPRLSIITPTLNRSKFIERAVRSVLAQEFDSVEHIVVDGGSTDGTLDVLAQFSGLRIVSGPDRGMYDALNKGLSLARGEYVGFLNSDDAYAEGAFAAAFAGLAGGGRQAVVGEAIFEDADACGLLAEGARFHPRSAPLLALVTELAPAFNAWFFQRVLVTSLGGFDIRYRIAGDREFMLRFALSRCPFDIVDAPIYRYRRHADSLTFAASGVNREEIVREHLLMSDDALARRELSADERHAIIRARTRDTLDMAMRGLRSGRIGAFMRGAAAGTRRDALWPARLLGRAFSAAAAQARR
jgi:glycosyltransferase involved in cell wall biosynthesis